MKTLSITKTLLAAALVGAFGLSACLSTAFAQDGAITPAPTQVSTPAPVHLDYAAAEVAKLAQAKVDDGTIVAYVNSSGNLFNLNADQIIYLRQVGASDAVIKAMLAHPLSGSTAATASSAPPSAAPVTSAPTVTSEAPVPTTTIITQPAVTYVQPVPVTTYYYSSPYYYGYPYSYGCYGTPAVSLSFGWGGDGMAVVVFTVVAAVSMVAAEVGTAGIIELVWVAQASRPEFW